MFCPKCGNQLDDGAAFCGKCGTSLGGPKSSGGASAPTSSATPTAAGVAAAATAAIDMTGSVMKKHGKLFIGAGVALVILVVAIVVAVNVFTGGFSLGQTSETFKHAFEQQVVYQTELPSSDYTNGSEYQVTSFEATDIKVQNDGWVTASVKAVVENDNFKVDMTYGVDYYPYPDTAYRSADQTGDYVFNLISKTVTPKKGIDKDEANGVSGEGLEIDEATGTCQTTTDKSYELWFADAVTSRTITYKAGEQGWYVENEETARRVTYKDLDGEYRAKTGDLTKIAQFTISDLNAEKGTFAITYKVNGWKEEGSWASSYSEASGIMSAAIEPGTDFGEPQEDGYAYYFEAQGDSDHGSGQASLSGFLVASDDGSKAIEISSMSIGQSEVSAGGNTRDTTFEGQGVIYKQ